MQYFLNYGVGVNSTAILALLIQGKLKYNGELYIVFADTGAEKKQTYQYLEYIKPILHQHGLTIDTVQSKEGTLENYCFTKKILPMRILKWCTDRWKRVPLEDYRKLKTGKSKDYKLIIGIDAGEQHRADKWKADENVTFPLIDLGLNRDGCISAIKNIGWEVPKKSGCYFCHNCKMQELRELSKENPEQFEKLCELERVTLERLSDSKMKGWYDEARPLRKAIECRYPEDNKNQKNLCCYCFT